MTKIKILNKWDVTGLLQNLTKKQKLECSAFLESITNYLISKIGNDKRPTKKEQLICGTLIPITRRLYDGGIKNIEPSVLFDNYVKFLGKKPKLSSKVKDKEAELCAIFCDNVINEFKTAKNKRKFTSVGMV